MHRKLFITIHAIGLLPFQFLLYAAMIFSRNIPEAFDVLGLGAVLHRDILIGNLIALCLAWIIFLNKKILKEKLQIFLFILIIVAQISILLIIKPYGFLS